VLATSPAPTTKLAVRTLGLTANALAAFLTQVVRQGEGIVGFSAARAFFDQLQHARSSYRHCHRTRQQS